MDSAPKCTEQKSIETPRLAAGSMQGKSACRVHVIQGHGDKVK